MYELTNYSEVVVKKVLDDYIANNNIQCKCERCLADIMAYALNHLPPRYFVSHKGEVLTSFESQTLPDRTRVLAEVVYASVIVAANPSHSKEN